MKNDFDRVITFIMGMVIDNKTHEIQIIGNNENDVSAVREFVGKLE